jgi:hypothetical protein
MTILVTAAKISTAGFSPTRIVARIAAAMLADAPAAEARVKARRNYERIVECEELLRGIGARRVEVLRARESCRY